MAARILLQNGSDALLAVNGNNLRLVKTFFDDVRQNIIDGLDGSGSEWDSERSNIPVTAVVRTSDAVVTITLPALAGYDISSLETVTATVPAVALAGAAALVASPTFDIDVGGAAATGRVMPSVRSQALQRSAVR